MCVWPVSFLHCFSSLLLFTSCLTTAVMKVDPRYGLIDYTQKAYEIREEKG